MPRLCTICSHDQRAAIDAAVVAGNSLRDIAGQFQLSKSSLARHASDHISQAIAENYEAGQAAAALNVVGQLVAINSAAQAILRDAQETKDGELALKAIDRIQKQIELQAKLLGDLDERPQVNILLSPEWVNVRTRIMVALGPYLEARLAVVAALADNGA